MTNDAESGGRKGRRTVPVWLVAVVGFGMGYAISGWLGGVIGLGFVILVSRFL
jgi:hypothetical protein